MVIPWGLLYSTPTRLNTYCAVGFEFRWSPRMRRHHILPFQLISNKLLSCMRSIRGRIPLTLPETKLVLIPKSTLLGVVADQVQGTWDRSVRCASRSHSAFFVPPQAHTRAYAMFLARPPTRRKSPKVAWTTRSLPAGQLQCRCSAFKQEHVPISSALTFTTSCASRIPGLEVPYGIVAMEESMRLARRGRSPFPRVTRKNLEAPLRGESSPIQSGRPACRMTMPIPYATHPGCAKSSGGVLASTFRTAIAVRSGRSTQSSSRLSESQALSPSS